jgi:hypothetical protein
VERQAAPFVDDPRAADSSLPLEPTVRVIWTRPVGHWEVRVSGPSWGEPRGDRDRGEDVPHRVPLQEAARTAQRRPRTRDDVDDDRRCAGDESRGRWPTKRVAPPHEWNGGRQGRNRPVVGEFGSGRHGSVVEDAADTNCCECQRGRPRPAPPQHVHAGHDVGDARQSVDGLPKPTVTQRLAIGSSESNHRHIPACHWVARRTARGVRWKLNGQLSMSWIPVRRGPGHRSLRSPCQR